MTDGKRMARRILEASARANGDRAVIEKAIDLEINRARLANAAKRNHPEWSDEQIDTFLGPRPASQDTGFEASVRRFLGPDVTDAGVVAFIAGR